ncbi:MAG: hypothetical protein E7221_00325 [Clostridiales bacterium]|nr:hypothetical protein [Clostridiales bacterium]MBQ3322647.1 hypothetical protein [Bacillota bacterium]
MDVEHLKRKLEKEIRGAVEQFQEREDITCRFGEPVIGYVSVDDVRFDMLFARGFNGHPREIYRPGRTIILYYLPFEEDIVKANEESEAPTEEWVRSYYESLWLAMAVNQTIRQVIVGQGRLISNLSNMVAWDDEHCREDWSYKFAAAIAGMGEMGPAGSFHMNGKYGGRVGGMITDGMYADKPLMMEGEELQKALEQLIEPCLHEGPCSEEMIAVCPGGAITAEGIDRIKCSAYCRTLNETTPVPEVCGKCFRFK